MGLALRIDPSPKAATASTPVPDDPSLHFLEHREHPGWVLQRLWMTAGSPSEILAKRGQLCQGHLGEVFPSANSFYCRTLESLMVIVCSAVKVNIQGGIEDVHFLGPLWVCKVPCDVQSWPWCHCVPLMHSHCGIRSNF